MEPKAIRVFNGTAGALLLGMAAALILSNASTWVLDPVPLRDPIFSAAIPQLFWIVGLIALAAGLFCLFAENPTWPALLSAWLAANYLVYRLGMISQGGHDLRGYLGNVSDAFGIAPGTASLLADATFLYLLLGGSFCFLWPWLARRDAHCPPSTAHHPTADRPHPPSTASKSPAPIARR